MKYKLGELVTAISGYAFKRKQFSENGDIPVIKIKNIESPKIMVDSNTNRISKSLFEKLIRYHVKQNDILISLTGSHIEQIGSMVGKVGMYDQKEPAILNQRVAKLCVKSTNKLDPTYFYYWILRKEVQRLLASQAAGTANQANISVNDIYELEIELPSLENQIIISNRIKKLDRKIQLNNQINDNLDALLTNIFKKYMINDDFEKSNLTQIANYKNGLAMQKYRPNSNEESLPVLKIKELNQGNTDDSSDRCSANLDNSVIVNTGDIIFSWSGTLLVKNWTGDKVGLNQHLFKVTSNKYPAWFIYEWTKYHLLRFQAIAAGKATTMGHIKRSDLKSSPVYIPSQLFLEKMDSQLAPIYSQRLNLIKENQQLSKLKQTLLNKYF